MHFVEERLYSSTLKLVVTYDIERSSPQVALNVGLEIQRQNVNSLVPGLQVPVKVIHCKFRTIFGLCLSFLR